MPLDMVLLGAPGAGKGTQAKRIAADYQLPQISTGDMLRAAVAAGTELGRLAEPIMVSGALVPDEIIVGLIRERLQEPDTSGGCIFDGFPRTIAQAEALDRMLPEIGRRIVVALLFDIDEGVAAGRMLGRAEEEGRSDDTPDTIRRRHEVYREQTEPLVEYYRDSSVLATVNAGAEVDEVYARVAAVLGAFA